MKSEAHARLLPFYFGAITDEERLHVERALLDEPDILVDYLDLKREIEAATPVPHGPSRELWQRLAERVARNPRRTLIALSLGVAIAASIVICLMMVSRPRVLDQTKTGTNGILFDPGHELSSGSGVL